MTIKNTDFVKAIGGFGEGFVKTLQSERERKQKELEFNQKMAFETRQMNLMNQVYQQRQALDEAQSFVNVGKDDVYNKLGVPEGKYHTSLMDNLISGYGKTETTPTYDIEGSYKNDKTGTYWTYDKGTGQPKDLGIPFDRNEGKTTTNVNVQTPTEPYADTTKLDESWNEYQRYQDLDKNWQNLEKKPMDKDGKEITYKQIREIKANKLKEIEMLTKDRAKKVSEEYVGFNSVFNDLLRDPSYKQAQNKDEYISRVMSGYPDEAIRLMKDLISKRIF